MTAGLKWIKSSHSGTESNDCVEVSLRWFKSSHSGQESNECVEVADHPQAVHIRDSKHKDGPCLAIRPHSWGRFASYAEAGAA
ncbi:DUF397 domain-containing protein [Streptomyces sp. UNOC14_S4]|uniref:DUF397 domain-containing protein n=1 Tax=Streptomyces sp. UNOC14_S4 TaxID=2872340 RepID=UPI001E3E1B31|nr:DUF397 domain-containing protein [Streptomyces sp. UNOC14_S4]MCC3771866.1 DUF397 domain-containing protein [Streptomyces sp. UNOC14_S4]